MSKSFICCCFLLFLFFNNNLNIVQVEGLCDPTAQNTYASNDCRKYNKCVYGEMSILTCAAGLLFDTQSGLCTQAAGINCAGTSVVVVGSGDVGNLGGGLESGIGDLSLGIGAGGNIGVGGTSGAGGLCLTNDYTTVAGTGCGTYNRCINGVLRALRCPRGFLFDVSLRLCVVASRVQCGDASNSSVGVDVGNGVSVGIGAGGGSTVNVNGGAIAIGKCTGSEDNALFPNSCSRYFRCIGGTLYSNECPAGNVYDVSTSTCVLGSTCSNVLGTKGPDPISCDLYPCLYGTSMRDVLGECTCKCAANIVGDDCTKVGSMTVSDPTECAQMECTPFVKTNCPVKCIGGGQDEPDIVIGDGNDGTDVVIGGDGPNVVVGGDGPDVVVGGGGSPGVVIGTSDPGTVVSVNGTSAPAVGIDTDGDGDSDVSIGKSKSN